MFFRECHMWMLMLCTSGDTTSEPEIRKKAAEKAQIQKPPTHFEDDSCVYM